MSHSLLHSRSVKQSADLAAVIQKARVQTGGERVLVVYGREATKLYFEAKPAQAPHSRVS